ncbi:putative aminopeptidase W07G4.4 [Lepisosteus oculatus]|uniref:putative aminopeptidase W07G4.4 n=1 Tax=Lepisosteus oculatus TaxID=7918 RepID=UPI0035F51DDB
MGFIGVQPVEYTTDCQDQRFDGIILVADSVDKLPEKLGCLQEPLQDYKSVDRGLCEEVVVLKVPGLPGNRLVFACTGPVNRDYDDIRRFSDAAVSGVKRAVKAGVQRPLLVCPPHSSYAESPLVAVLGALHALYVPLELREAAVMEKDHKVETLGVWVPEETQGRRITHLATALESGRVVCRDIGGSDPERMAAPRVAQYVQDLFKGTEVKVSVISHVGELQKEYPCLAAVNRCANAVVRHQARVIKLEYCGEGPIENTLLLVGKGITYDTGGADIKAGGVMAGMHRDKCGSAAVAGFFQVLAELKPKHLKVLGAMAMVRNSVGADCYVSDELIVSRAGQRIRVGNTDAEGRMVMADLLCEMKEKAVSEVAPEIFTIATLTGHAIRAMGSDYSIIMDNGEARKAGNAHQWQQAGEVLGDVFEVSMIRRDDFEFHRGKSEYEDLLQSNNLPSTLTPRGHQTPAAFLIMASGLDKHGTDSEQPLRYSHIDIAGSSGPFPGIPTGAPILAMATRYVLPCL